ncbi:MAG: hypothetical protein DMG06_20410 [Acidobacteria bacterium]|nr:MAG: hypothetical protein DMG06_20410 [Acidobacteriota bacterium]
MIFPAKIGLALSLSCPPLCALAAQDRTNTGAIAKSPVIQADGRLLSVEEGIAVLKAAREHRRQARSKPDCSHLVQQVYAMVGLEYPFASSRELYQGVESFEQVAKPQPGDLIVWRGHVGLVISPVQRTFYSSVSSGLKTESYYSPYWRQRGRPRFYRYRFEGNENFPIVAANLGTDPVALLAIPDPAEDEPTVPPATSLPEDTVLISEGREPTQQAIEQALIAYTDGSTMETATLPGSFIIFDQLRVDRLKVKGKQATARLELHAPAAVAGESVDLRDKRIKVPLELKRTPQGWLLRKPQPVYLSRRAGIRVLAEHLAELARSDSDPQQQARLAGVLNDLLNR